MQDLAPGDYTITVKNTDGCTSNASATVKDAPKAPDTPLLATTDPTCEVPTGSITVTEPLGTKFSYSIDGGTTYQTEVLFTGLAPDDYTITVKNNAGCTSNASATVKDAPKAPDADAPFDTIVCDSYTLPPLINGHYFLQPGSIDSVAAGTDITQTTTLYVAAGDPDAGCYVENSFTVTITDKQLPLITQLGPYCLDSKPDYLQLISNNGITGTWYPATIATDSVGIFTYIFTPDDGQCAVEAKMTIEITDKITPIIKPIGPLDAGSKPPPLPAVSVNGISGRWSPATISTANVATTKYTFTPDADQCAVPVSIDIEVTAVKGPKMHISPYNDDCDPPIVYTNKIELNEGGGVATPGDCPLNWSTLRKVSDRVIENGCPKKIYRTYEIYDSCGQNVSAIQEITINRYSCSKNNNIRRKI